MKKFNVFYKNDEQSIRISNKIKNQLREASFEYNEETPDLVISIGGDGTMLRAIHQYQDILDEVAFCGVHTGSLGFYTDFLVSEVAQLLENIINQDFYTVSFNMLEVNIVEDNNTTTIHALNEARLENNKHTQVMEILIDDEHFETFRGNGLNFSTPTGSTGYNKSLGGAILHPKTKAFQVCEIAAINNIAYRTLGSPLILNQEKEVKINLRGLDGVVLGYDSYVIDLKNEYPTTNYLTFCLSDKKVTFARYKRLAFMDRVKKNFICEDL
ncbi:MAG: NAD kinase [Erysipelotrichales bacterium]